MLATTDDLPKPTGLMIRAEGGRLVGTDGDGVDWTIRWCGNGAYSHWTLIPRTATNPTGNLDSGRGWYEFIYTGPEYEREERSSLLEKQIREAERAFRIYR